MSRNEDERSDPRTVEPVFYPPLPGVTVMAAERAYRSYLDLLGLESHVLLVLADLTGDHQASQRLRDAGMYDRVLELAGLVDRLRGLTPNGAVDASGRWVPIDPASERAVLAKRVTVEDIAIVLVGIILSDALLVEHLERSGLLRRLAHLRMSIVLRRQDAAGIYAECLAAPRNPRRPVA